MVEYIEREALIAAYNKAHKGPPGGARKLMEEAPAVDVVAVVRCGECVRRYTGLCSLYMGQMNGNAYLIQQGDDFFCKKGQRDDNG